MEAMLYPQCVEVRNRLGMPGIFVPTGYISVRVVDFVASRALCVPGFLAVLCQQSFAFDGCICKQDLDLSDIFRDFQFL